MESAGLSSRLIAALALAMTLPSTTYGAGEPVLEAVATIELPGIKGRIDHLSADLKRHRLFVAALGNNTVEVLDVEHHRHEKSLKGFEEPQGVLYLPDPDRLYVANGNGERLDILDGSSFAPVKRIAALPGEPAPHFLTLRRIAPRKAQTRDRYRPVIGESSIRHI